MLPKEAFLLSDVMYYLSCITPTVGVSSKYQIALSGACCNLQNPSVTPKSEVTNLYNTEDIYMFASTWNHWDCFTTYKMSYLQVNSTSE